MDEIEWLDLIERIKLKKLQEDEKLEIAKRKNAQFKKTIDDLTKNNDILNEMLDNGEDWR